MTDEFATIPFHLDLFSAALVELAKSIPVHSLILSSHLVFWLPLFLFHFTAHVPGRVAQSVGHLTRKPRVLGSIPGLATYFRFSSAFSRRAVVSYWRKYVHEVLANRLGGLSLPRKSVVRLTDRPDMTLDVYRGRKTTMQQQQQQQITVPCRIVFAKPEDLETWPNHLIFRFLTRVRSLSYSPMAAWIFLRTSSLVTWSIYEMCSIASGSISSQKPAFFSLTLQSRSMIHSVHHHGVSRAEFSLTEPILLQAVYIDHSRNPRLLYGSPWSRTHGR